MRMREKESHPKRRGERAEEEAGKVAHKGGRGSDL